MSEEGTNTLDELTPEDRHWALHMLRTLDKLGSSTRNLDVLRHIRAEHGSLLPERTWAWIQKSNRLGWSKVALRNKRLITSGGHGIWKLTDRGRRALAESADEAIDLSCEQPPENTEIEAKEDVESETKRSGFEVPVLEALASKASDQRAVERHVEQQYGHELASGDRRPYGDDQVVWTRAIARVLSALMRSGHAENPSRGQWAITEAGRRRLEDARETRHSLKPFQTSRTSSLQPLLARLRRMRRISFFRKALNDLVPAALLDGLVYALRPELGASPSSAARRSVILYGPPGTGKTWIAEAVARALTGGHDPFAEGYIRLVQFHPSYGYEDFVWGIRPALSANESRFEERKGPFLDVCEAATEEPDRNFVLIIDEINRGDPARIFGELLYALEYRNREVELASGGKLLVPPNLIVIGTMNSVDRSVALVDYALRRRFTFLRVDPTPEIIAAKHPSTAGRAAEKALRAVNKRICDIADPDHQIGQSYFLSPGGPLRTRADLEWIWKLDIEPQLVELFHGRVDRVKDLNNVWRQQLDETFGKAPKEGGAA